MDLLVVNNFDCYWNWSERRRTSERYSSILRRSDELYVSPSLHIQNSDLLELIRNRHRRYSKISQRSLVKHFIALRVRLSTAKLSWTQEFLGIAKGLDALQSLLGKIALQKINRGETPTEEDRAVQSEILKCLRVLMNTDVSLLSYW